MSAPDLKQWSKRAFTASIVSMLAFGAFTEYEARQAPVPDLALGRTLFVTVYNKGFSAGGYVEPWIGNIYHLLMALTAATFVVYAVGWATGARSRKFGDNGTRGNMESD